MIQVRAEIQAMLDEVTNNRRYLHRHPEIELDTPHTKAYCMERLKEYGIEEFHEGYAKNGFLAILRVNDKNEYIGFRTDMDALPIKDMTTSGYVSENEGKAHACGHDGHMSILMGLAHYLSRHRNELKENIAFIFQPGEEGPGGARLFVEAGLYKDYPMKAVIGTHLMSDVPAGYVACKAGPMMARNGEFNIDIYGQSSHGAMPHLGNDALVAACDMVMQLQSIVSRNVDPLAPAVVTVGKIDAGQARNVICDHAYLMGTMRAFSDEVYELIKRRIYEIGKGISLSYPVKVEPVVMDYYYVVDNDAVLNDVLKAALGEDYILQTPKMIAEDFSFYQREAPGLFFYTGIGDEDHQKGIHDCAFDYLEKNLLNGIETEVRLLEHLDALPH